VRESLVVESTHNISGTDDGFDGDHRHRLKSVDFTISVAC
jgi:hypothetical protein